MWHRSNAKELRLAEDQARNQLHNVGLTPLNLLIFLIHLHIFLFHCAIQPFLRHFELFQLVGLIARGSPIFQSLDREFLIEFDLVRCS